MEANITLSNDEARAYFKNSGLSYDDITTGDILALVMLLNKAIKNSIKADECISTLRLSEKTIIKCKSNGCIKECYLYLNSHYFTKRECISFHKNGFIGFCGWADERNSKPILMAFITWVYFLTEEK